MQVVVAVVGVVVVVAVALDAGNKVLREFCCIVVSNGGVVRNNLHMISRSSKVC